MTPEQFCYWLQGKCELDPSMPTEAQWECIMEHLKTVFVKVTSPLKTTTTIPPNESIRYYLDGSKEWPPNPITC